MQKRRRFKQSASFKDRLKSFAREARERAEELPPGFQRNEMLLRARQAEASAHLEDWLNSPGLQPPS